MGFAKWKKRFLDMDTGVSKITIAQDVSQNCIQREGSEKQNTTDDRLVRILNVKTLGSEVDEILKPKFQNFSKMSPLEYQGKLQTLCKIFQDLKEKESRNAIKLLYQDAERVLQAETISADLLEEFRIMLLQG